MSFQVSMQEVLDNSAAFKYFKDPVEVEFITAQAGLDIGGTSVGDARQTRASSNSPYLA